MDDLYHENILDHFRNPHHYSNEVIPKALHTQGLNASCGDSLDIQVLIEDGKIQDVHWQGQGCAISQSSMSMLADWMIGKSVEEALRFTKPDLLGLVGVDTIAATREKCLMLGLSSMQRILHTLN